MRVPSYKRFIGIAVTLLVLLTLPPPIAEGIRSGSAASTGFIWRWTRNVGDLIFTPFSYLSLWVDSRPYKLQQRLQQENDELCAELSLVKQRLAAALESELQEQELIHWIQQLSNSEAADFADPLAHRMQRRERLDLARAAVEMIPAHVIYRSPGLWGSSIWVDVGEADNEQLGLTIISKDSPVIAGDALVGVVEEVRRHRCRIRLISDSALSPSVRTARGGIQRSHLANLVAQTWQGIGEYPGALLDAAGEKELDALLQQLLTTLQDVEDPTFFLAKGELAGDSRPIWRIMGSRISGTGFNYDTADAYGPSRDLRSGIPEGTHSSTQSAISLVSPGDILVTTGFDGVFPPGLKVGQVTQVDPLEEGAYFYSLQARPCAPRMEDLSTVFILPAIR